MLDLAQLFVWHIDPALLMAGVYDPWLVALSVGVSIFASTMGLHAAWQARLTAHAGTRRWMLLAGSVALGTGVWAMHFVGMLAFQLCTAINFDVPFTLASALPAVGAAYVALRLLSQPHVARQHVVLGGALMGAGIGAMHYTGMAAMRLSAQLRYDPTIFGLSVAVAVVLAILALGLRFGLAARLQGRPMLLTGVSGVFMGAAISGMHYTGMSAARFVGHNHSTDHAPLLDPAPLALGITLVTVVATVMVAGVIALARYRQLLQAITAQSSELQAVFDTSIDGLVVFNDRGQILSLNAGAQRITGWSPSALVGGPIAAMLVPPWAEEARGDFLGFIARRQFDEPMETHLCCADGRAVPVRLTMGRTTGEAGGLYVAAFADIGEQQAMQKALRHSEQQFRSLIGNIPGISFRFRLAPGWPLVYISDAVEAFTGHGPLAYLGDAPDHALFSLVPPEQREALRQQMTDAVHSGQPFRLEFQMRHADGGLRWMWGTGQAVRSHEGDTTWVDGVMLDITDRRGMEEALRAAKLQAEEAMHARTAFLANMSHEIRTPMNAIIGFTEVVLAATKEPTARQHLLTVRTAARSLMVLLNDILDSSKLERGAVELEHLPYNPRQLIKQVADEQVLVAQRKGLKLVTDCDAAVPDVLMGDGHRVRQVLVNLLSNAVKFTAQGQVTVGAHVSDTGRLRLWVRDTGIGIPADRQARIFEAFTQADASMSRRFGGTGLGTAISRQLVELMGGRIWVESREGEGSTFHVELPCEPAGVHGGLSDTQPGVLTDSAPLAPAARSWRVLVVDDARDNAELLAVILAHEGHVATLVDGGAEAVAHHAQGRFDAILMDLQMPEMDGLAAARAIRAQEARSRLPRVPILALSATRRPETDEAVAAAGMDGFMLKPAKPAALLAELRRLVAQPARSAASDPDTGEPLLQADLARERWGDDEAWAQALAQFCRHKRDWLRNNDPDTPPHAQEALAVAHRFRGVSASLSMPALAAAAADLALHVERRLPLGDAWLRVSRVVNATLAVAQAEWDSVTRELVQTQAADASPANLVGDAQWSEALHAVVECLHRGEHPDEHWHRVSASGTARFGAGPWMALTQAIEDFDFDVAAERAEALLLSFRAPA
ncbi:MAG: hypothetical protein RI907_3417 [Pseudomonadota bacterium]